MSKHNITWNCFSLNLRPLSSSPDIIAATQVRRFRRVENEDARRKGWNEVSPPIYFYCPSVNGTTQAAAVTQSPNIGIQRFMAMMSGIPEN
jgi:hypothetical protein